MPTGALAGARWRLIKVSIWEYWLFSGFEIHLFGKWLMEK